MRNNSIELLRFVFCLLIINYHLFSHYLISEPYPNYFSRGYMGDEFFFIVTGFYFAKASNKARLKPSLWNIKQLSSRIRKIAIPYYLTWIACFAGVRLTNSVMGIKTKSVFLDLANSIFELLFLEMFGFIKGLYSNDVGWFFSALLIATFILGPLLAKYKQSFALYVAPMIALLFYGILSLNYDYLFNPYLVLPNMHVLKGLVRAMAAVSLGVFMNGVVETNWFREFAKGISAKVKIIICLVDVCLWCAIVGYMVYPFSTNAAELSIQYDYIIAVFLPIALLPVLGELWTINSYGDKVNNAAAKLGKYAFYAYFGQAVFYSVDRLIYTKDISVIGKALVLNVSVAVVSILLAVATKGIRRIGLLVSGETVK